MTSLISSIRERDPAKPTFFEVVLAYNGFHAVILHGFNQALWKMGLKAVARFFANLTRLFTGIEIHPEARVGERLFIDHGTGVVIGQTSLIGNDVTIYHGVTLGGKGGNVNGEKRHPTIMDGAIIGAGAQVLGNISIGRNVRVGSNAVVTKSVPDDCIVIGNPGRLIQCREEDQGRAYGLPREAIDPVMNTIAALRTEVQMLKKQVENKD